MSERKRRSRRKTPQVTNWFKVIPDAWDASVVFGMSRLDEEAAKWVIDEHVPKVMNWGLAKTLAYSLLAHIAGYENRFGTIRVHPAQVPGQPRPDQVSPEDAARLAALHEALFSQEKPASPPAMRPLVVVAKEHLH